MKRHYRRRVGSTGLATFAVRVEQTDLFIRAETDLSAMAYDLVWEGRRRVEEYARSHPDFLTGMLPLTHEDRAPSPVQEMLLAGRAAGVGPMAAVAGAMAEFVGSGLYENSPGGVIVENGGDVFIRRPQDTVVGLFAGEAAVSMRMGLNVPAEQTPVGVCTSSGTLGHSFSRGRADAATVVGRPTALADAAATALGNRVADEADIEPALNWVMSVPGVLGAAVVIHGRVGLLGDLQVIPL